jgi:hypothetical protein
METPTFASFLTPEGTIVAAGLITALIQLVKVTFPVIDAKVSGAVMAFSASALLYTVTALVTMPEGPDAYLTVIASWLLCATASVGAYSATKFAKGTSG